jgi:hypothetical protein
VSQADRSDDGSGRQPSPNPECPPAADSGSAPAPEPIVPSPDAEYPLQAPDPDSIAEPAMAPLREPAFLPPPARRPFQFSLSEAFWLLVVLTLLLGLLRAVPRNWAAFLFGLVVFFSLVTISLLKIERPIVHVGWWAMLVIYVLVCMAALLIG